MGKGGASGKVTEVAIKAPVTAAGEVLVYDMAPSGGGGAGINFSTVISLSTLNVSLGSAESSTSAEHTGIDSSEAREFMLAGKITKGGTPTNILIEVRCATNATTSLRFQYQNGFWGDLRWDDTAVGSDGVDFALIGEVMCGGMSVFATMTGAAGTTFTLADMYLTLRD